ncbi:aminopeptidase [Nocardia yunnanensis]|uniref:Aminopeptidase n=1 Tax=Nocardia yunnanensis TaxID=2382165 RepID=A0A386Z881_9NOCA|nr:AMP-binding protein [Nocardia yunnanensis]AYF73828.1 aminopeptidase [Nocardia yunnanensis]
MNDAPDATAIVRRWLLEPSADTGIHLADEADGWEFRSYRELADQVWAIAAALRANGLGSGDGACVIMPTGFPCAAAFYAVWACGGVFTPVAPPMFGDLEQIVAHIAGILEQAAPRVVVTSPEFETFVRAAATAAGRPDEPLVIDAAALPAAPAARELAPASEVALLQFTSGSSGAPRGVRVSWPNLANNIDMISRLIDWRDGETMVSWLPLYHDMGLVGAFLTGVTNQARLYLMRPDQFVRDPIRWLRAMTHAQHSPSPSFALGYVAHRVRPEQIADLDLSGWRTLAIGSEPVEVADLQAFAKLTGPQGFSMGAFTLAYGLAEATLMVTSSPTRRPITALRLDNPNLRFGQRVPVLEEAVLDDTHRVDGAGWITGLGFSTPESTVTVVDDEGRELPDGVLGEMVVTGDSIALGYSGPPSTGSSTRIEHGRLYSGDAGFLYRGEVFVLGRMGTSIKVRGRSVFMEDIESRIAQETGLTKGKLAAVGIAEAGVQGVALFAETAPGDWMPQARAILRGLLGPAQLAHLVTGPRGLIRRTSSGKPRRRHMWQLLKDGELPGAVLHEEPDEIGAMRPPAEDEERTASKAAALGDQATPGGGAQSSGPASTPGLPPDRLRQLLDGALRTVAVPEDAAVLFEGSLAEGFGNAGSDIDFLVVAPGADELPTLPTVLFLDGRRVEVRTRSVAQLRRQLERVTTDPDEDTLNRCQRFLRATVVRAGAVDLEALRELVDHTTFAGIVADWWAARARHALRYAMALRAFGTHAEADAWAQDGLRQAMKAWLARRGETYLETKWLPQQLARVGDHELIDRYRSVRDSAPEADRRRESDQATVRLAADLGVDGVSDDPDAVIFTRRPGVTTWPLGGRLHVLRSDSEVFALSDAGARAWRSVVFRQSIGAVLARAPHDIGPALAEFVRLGFVGLQWRGGEVLEPALAMCKPVPAYTPVASASTPALGLTGARSESGPEAVSTASEATGAIATLSALPAARFIGCGLNLVWSNVVLENAREDLVGAIKDAQGEVADIAAHRLIAMSVRVLLSAYGIHPLPADVDSLGTVARLLPTHDPRRGELIAVLESAGRVRLSATLRDGGDPLADLAVLDAVVTAVRGVAADPGSRFPASFDSREQWQRTLTLGYDWLRLAGYLDAALPLDEARDLLASGGQQPHLRESEQS